MSRWIAVLVLVVVAACSQPAPGKPAEITSAPPSSESAPTPTSTPIATTSAIPTPPTPPFADLAVSPVGFSCRLPFYDSEGSSVTDGFISFPGKAVRIDPGSNKGMYFDMAYSRWLPVPRAAVAPDGTRYAYVELSPDGGVYLIHIVEVATGKDRVVSQNVNVTKVSVNPSVFDFESEGIYLVGGFEHIWPGVWLFDPVNGTTRRVADVEWPEMIGPEAIGPGKSLWFGDISSADPNPFNTASSAGILPDEVRRFDLKSATRGIWMYQPGHSLEVIGVDMLGRPVIKVGVPAGGGIGTTAFLDHSKSELLLGLNDFSQRSIYRGQLVETLGNPIADSHGVWFGSPQGIYLYTATGALIKVSNQPGYPANGCI